MDSIRLWVRQLEAWWAYTLSCAQAPGCDMSRTWVTLAVVVAAVVGLWVLRRMLKKFFAEKAERMRLAESARVADQGTMAEYRADVDKLYVEPEQENVQQRIRQALDERKSQDQWQRPGGSGKPGASK
jgi:FtsZ-interacting cell division protein ZipA